MKNRDIIELFVLTDDEKTRQELVSSFTAVRQHRNACLMFAVVVLSISLVYFTMEIYEARDLRWKLDRCETKVCVCPK